MKNIKETIEIVGNQDTPSDVLSEIFEKFKDNSSITKLIAKHKNINDFLAEKLFDIDFEHKKILCYNHNISTFILEKIFSLESIVLNNYLSLNKNLSEELFHKLFNLNNSNILINLTLNENAPPSLLKETALKTKNIRIILNIINNKNTPKEAYFCLLDNNINDNTIINFLSKSINTPKETLYTIYDKFNSKNIIIYNILHNKNADINLRKKIFINHIDIFHMNGTALLEDNLLNDEYFNNENILNFEEINLIINHIKKRFENNDFNYETTTSYYIKYCLNQKCISAPQIKNILDLIYSFKKDNVKSNNFDVLEKKCKEKLIHLRNLNISLLID